MVLVSITAVFVLISLGIESTILTKAVRWTEIIIVLSFFAGLLKFLGRQTLSVSVFFRDVAASVASRKRNTAKTASANADNKLANSGNRKQQTRRMLNSLIIIVSAATTFILCFVNPNQSRYTFENIVREQPDFLGQTALVLIENDIYLSKFPSKKKLALYISHEVSSDFFPSEEMLRSADISLENYQKLITENKIARSSDASADSGITFINPSEMKQVKEIKERVRTAAVGIISDMFPIAQELKDWFDKSVASLRQQELESELEQREEGRFEDFRHSEIVIEGSGTELEKWIASEQAKQGGDSGTKLKKEMLRYNKFLMESDVSGMTAEKLSNLGSSPLPPESKKRIAEKFLETGITISPEIKGFIRWIYRYIFDPLLSSFAALLLLNMISTVYSRFSIKNYSYCVITLAFVFTLAGFTNSYGLFAQNNLPGWNGPLSPGWLMNALAVPVFKALAIGTASGLLFFTAENFYTTFFPGKRRDK